MGSVDEKMHYNLLIFLKDSFSFRTLYCFAKSHFNLPEGSYGNGRGTEVVCIIAAFLRKAGPSLLRWPEGKTGRGRALAKRGGKLEDSPSLVRTRVLGLLLLL